MAGVDILSNKPEDIAKDQKRLRTIMKGEKPGFISQTPDKEDIKPDKYAFKKKAKNMQEKALAAYDFASMRDAFYCTVGRKYMRRQAVAGKIVAELRRAVALKQIDAEIKESK